MNDTFPVTSQAEMIFWRRHYLPLVILEAVRRKPRSTERLVDVVLRAEKARGMYPKNIRRRGCRIWTIKHLQDMERQGVLLGYEDEGEAHYMAKNYKAIAS